MNQHKSKPISFEEQSIENANNDSSPSTPKELTLINVVTETKNPRDSPSYKQHNVKFAGIF